MSSADPDRVEALLARVESDLSGGGPLTVYDEAEFARIPAMIAVYRSGRALLAGDIEATMQHADRALELVGSDDPLQRGAAAALLGLARWNLGDLDAAAERYAESIGCFERGGYVPDLMGCSLALSDIQIAQGRLRDARRTFEGALAHAVGHPGRRGSADMHAGLSLLALERNDLDAAARHLQTCAELGEHMGLPQHPYRWRVASALWHRARGETAAALELLEEAAARYYTDFSPPVRPVTAWSARLHLDRGEVDEAARWAEDAGLDVDDDLSYVREFEHITLARILVARGSDEAVEQACGLLDRLLAAADDGHRRGSSIEILVVLASAHRAADREQRAREALSRALERADGEGYARVFLDGGPAMVAMLEDLDGPAGDQAERVLSTRSTVPSDAPLARRPAAGPDQLSRRELDVLQLLRGDLSGPEIARELHVSLNTLRTHTKHIYTKLGVTNRRQAVGRAAELGL